MGSYEAGLAQHYRSTHLRLVGSPPPQKVFIRSDPEKEALNLKIDRLLSEVTALSNALDQKRNTIWGLQQNLIKLRKENSNLAFKNSPPIRKIIELVCAGEAMTRAEVSSRRRSARCVLPRHMICYLAHKYTKGSLKMIGEALGGKDHTTVMHAIASITSKIMKDSFLKAKIEFYEETLVNSGEKLKDEIFPIDLAPMGA